MLCGGEEGCVVGVGVWLAVSVFSGAPMCLLFWIAGMRDLRE